jgi:hypothetical protein
MNGVIMDIAVIIAAIIAAIASIVVSVIEFKAAMLALSE